MRTTSSGPSGARCTARRIGLVLLLALALSGCWYAGRGNSQNTGWQSYDPAITVGNVHGLRPEWVAPDASSSAPGPVVTDVQTAFVNDAGRLLAYDAAGLRNCSTTVPRQCDPMWIGRTAIPNARSSPAATIGGDFVFFVGSVADQSRIELLVFDRRGQVRCAGTAPRICDPVWRADLPFFESGSVTVENGLVYAPTADGVRVFDANGVQGCTTAAPRVCTPRWIASGHPPTRLTAPTVADSRLYVATGDGIDVFDATGTRNCTGAPKVCTPLFNLDRAGAPGAFGTVAVLDGRAYSVSELNTGQMHAWDATGAANCSAGPAAVCTPIWTSSERINGVPAVAAGVVYAMGEGANAPLLAFDATGNTACAGTPRVCTPLWRGPANFVDWAGGGPSVANGVVYVTTMSDSMYAFDAAGTTNCSGSPRLCTPLARFEPSQGIHAPASIATGLVLTVGSGGRVTAWRLPASG
jgi:outer membrane protein assembly factor BamB